MAGICTDKDGNAQTGLEIAVNDRKQLERAGIGWNYSNQLLVAINSLNCWKQMEIDEKGQTWLEMACMAANDCIWLQMCAMAGNG